MQPDNVLVPNVKHNINKFPEFSCRDKEHAQSFDRIRWIKPLDKIVVYGYTRHQKNISQDVQDLILLFHSFLMVKHSDPIENHVSQIIKHNMNIERQELLQHPKKMRPRSRTKKKKHIRSFVQYKYKYFTQQKKNTKIVQAKRDKHMYHRW